MRCFELQDDIELELGGYQFHPEIQDTGHAQRFWDEQLRPQISKDYLVYVRAHGSLRGKSRVCVVAAQAGIANGVWVLHDLVRGEPVDVPVDEWIDELDGDCAGLVVFAHNPAVDVPFRTRVQGSVAIISTAPIAMDLQQALDAAVEGDSWYVFAPGPRRNTESECLDEQVVAERLAALRELLAEAH